MSFCPICGNITAKILAPTDGRDATRCECPRCGEFTLSETLRTVLPRILTENPDAEAKLSHFVRRQSERVALNTGMVAAILGNPLPRPREQADLLIRWMAENLAGPGEMVRLEFERQGAVIGSKTAAGFKLVLDHLFETKMITGTPFNFINRDAFAEATLSFAGWDYYEQLRVGGTAYRKAFMAMKFGDEELDRMLETTFRPAARRAGFELRKLDDVPKAGLIDDHLRVEIQSSDFLVADLTHANNGAYWEAGYAEGLGKPVIYTCETKKFDSDKPHFDTNHHLTVVWDAAEPATAGKKLTATIRATLPHLAIFADDDPEP